jgi:hypothetical protein
MFVMLRPPRQKQWQLPLLFGWSQFDEYQDLRSSAVVVDRRVELMLEQTCCSEQPAGVVVQGVVVL